jgi:hypothetical protein
VARDKKVLDRRDEDPKILKCFRCQGVTAVLDKKVLDRLH